MAYEAGTAFMQVVPSFEGAITSITEKFTEYGDQAGQVFSDAFKESAKTDVNVGPGDAESASQGESSGGAFADAFKAHVEAALRNLPDVAIGADSTPADIKIAEIRQNLEELSGQTVGIDISDTDALAKIDEVKLDLDELGTKSPSIQVKVDAAAAIVELEAVKLAADEASGESNVSGGGGGISGLATSMSGLSTNVSPLISSILAFGTALVPIAAVATAASIGLAGMATAALAGVGAFGLAALPVFLNVSQATSLITTDTIAMNRAISQTAYNTAAKKLQVDLANLDPTTRQVTLSLVAMRQAFLNWDAQFDPLILQVFNAAMADIIPTLDALTPLVTAGGNALTQFFQAIGQAVQATDFKQFISWLATQVGPAVSALTTTFLNFSAGFSKMFENAAPFITIVEQGLVSLSAQFEKMAESNGFKDFIAYAVKEGPTVGAFFEQLVQLIGRLLAAAAPVGAVILSVIVSVVEFVNKLLAWNPIITTIVIALIAMAGAVLLVIPAVAALGAALLFLDANPVVLAISLIVVGLAALVVGIIYVSTHWTQTWAEIKRVFDEALSFLRSGFGTLVVLLLGPLAPLALIALHWQQLWSGMQAIAEPVWAVLENDILHPLEDFFSVVLPPVIDAFTAIWNVAWTVISTALQVAWDIMKVIFQIIITVAILPIGLAVLVLQGIWQAVWPIISGALQTAWSIMQPVFDFIKTLGIDVIQTEIGLLQTAWNVAWGLISDALSTAWSIMGPIFGFIVSVGIAVVSAAVSAFQAVWGAVWPVVSAALSAAWSVMSPIFGFIVSTGITAIQTAIGALQTIWNTVWSGLSGAVSLAWSGMQATFGLIESAINAVVGAVNALINAYNSIPLLPNVPNVPKIPGHASGGDIPPNEWSVVGELGPELFYSGGGGRMIPNSALTGTGTVDLSGTSSNSDVVAELRGLAAILQAAPASTGAHVGRVIGVHSANMVEDIAAQLATPFIR